MTLSLSVASYFSSVIQHWSLLFVGFLDSYDVSLVSTIDEYANISQGLLFLITHVSVFYVVYTKNYSLMYHTDLLVTTMVLLWNDNSGKGTDNSKPTMPPSDGGGLTALIIRIRPIIEALGEAIRIQQKDELFDRIMRAMMFISNTFLFSLKMLFMVTSVVILTEECEKTFGTIRICCLFSSFVTGLFINIQANRKREAIGQRKRVVSIAEYGDKGNRTLSPSPPPPPEKMTFDPTDATRDYIDVSAMPPAPIGTIVIPTVAASYEVTSLFPPPSPQSMDKHGDHNDNHNNGNDNTQSSPKDHPDPDPPSAITSPILRTRNRVYPKRLEEGKDGENCKKDCGDHSENTKE